MITLSNMETTQDTIDGKEKQRRRKIKKGDENNE
jgi:hypothetical protein